MTTTKYLQLPIPSKSDRGKIITECLDPAFTKMDQKIESIDLNIDFNLLATLGIPYGGILNNTNAKVAGTAYYDTANKKIYKCTANTSINYADAGYFIEVSNNDLLGKLQNLSVVTNDNHNLSNKRHVFIVSPTSTKSIRLATDSPNNTNRIFLLRTTNNGQYSETLSILTVGNGYLKKYDINTDPNTQIVYNNLGVLSITNNNGGNIEVQISPLQLFEKDFLVTEL